MSNLRHLIRGISQLDVKPKNPEGEVTRYGKYIARLRAPLSLAESVQTATKLVSWIQQFNLGDPSEPWLASRRLMRADMPASARNAGFEVFVACVQCRAELPVVTRYMFFQSIEADFCQEDFDLQIQALFALTNGARNIAGLEAHICTLLSKWTDRALNNLDATKTTIRRTVLLTNTLRHQDLRQVMVFMTHLVKFNFSVIEELNIASLVNKAVLICKRTGDVDDIREALSFWDALIRYGYIPAQSLTEVINVLSSVYHGLQTQRGIALNVMSNLLKSHMAQNAFRSLQNNIRGSSNVHDDVIVGGLALFTSAWLAEDDAQIFSTFDCDFVLQCYKDGLLTKHTRTDRNQVRLDAAYLQSVGTLLSSNHVVRDFTYDDWLLPLELVTIMTRSLPRTASDDLQSVDIESQSREVVKLEYLSILKVLEIQYYDQKSSIPHQSLTDLWLNLHTILEPESAKALLRYNLAELRCYPGEPAWLHNISDIGSKFLFNSHHLDEVQSQLLEQFIELMGLVGKTEAANKLHPCLLKLFKNIKWREGEAGLKAVVVLSNIANLSSPENIKEAVEQLSKLCKTESTFDGMSVQRSRRGSGASMSSAMTDATRNSKANRARQVSGYKSPPRMESPTLPAVQDEHSSELSAAAVKALAAVFVVHFTAKPSEIGQVVFDAILNLANDPNTGQQTRLNVCALLTRLRADSESSLYLDPVSVDLLQPSTTQSNAISVAPYSGIRSDYTCDNDNPRGVSLPIARYLQVVVNILLSEYDWQICVAWLTGLKHQLSNRTLFLGCGEGVLALRSLMCDQLNNRSSLPCFRGDVRREDATIVLVEFLTMLLGYHASFTKSMQDDIVAAAQATLMRYQKATPACITLLSVTAYELPLSLAKNLTSILMRSSQLITSSAASVPILEFLSALAKIPDLYVNFREEDYRRVFGIALQHIQHANASSRDAIAADHPDPLQQSIPRYVLNLAFNTLYAWFLALRLSQRPKYLKWIVDGLWASNAGGQGLDERAQVCYDFLARFCYSNVEIRSMGTVLQDFEAEHSSSKSWLYGNAVITMRTMHLSGLTEMTVRRPSGSVSFLCKPNSDLEALSIISSDDARAILSDGSIMGPTEAKIVSIISDQDTSAFTPSHMLLQMVAAPDLYHNEKPILLPDDAATKRALATFDRIPVVDFHKIGVVYIGRGQVDQTEILANTYGSPDYVEFLTQLGDLVRLKDNTDIYTGGLDTSTDEDGEFAYIYREKITQIIFHTCTLMPSKLEIDPTCNRKKAHIGNDFVNIIWNSSNRAYDPETIRSDFNFINIVVSPEAFQSTRSPSMTLDNDAFFKVKILPHKDLPPISPATDWRMISRSKLSQFVRTIAVQCNAYAQIHHSDGQYSTMWRQRLERIITLRRRATKAPEEEKSENADLYFTVYN